MSFSTIQRFFKPPTAVSEDQTQMASVLNSILWISIIACTLYSPVLLIQMQNSTFSLIAYFGYMLLLVGLLILIHRGRIQLAAFLLPFTSWFYLTVLLIFLGGIRNPLMNGYVLIILATGLILGKKRVIQIFVFSFSSAVTLLIFEINGILPKPLIPLTDNYIWGLALFILFATAVFLYMTIDRLEDANTNLRKNENLYRTLIDYSNMVMCRWLPDTTLTYANEKYRASLNISENYEGIRWVDLYAAEHRQATLDFYQKAVENPEVSFHEQKIVHDNGREQYFQWIDTPLQNEEGQVVEFQGVGLDITNLKDAEKALRASELRYRQLFENMANSFANHSAVRNEDGQIVDFVLLDVNKAYETSTGFKQEEIVGKKIKDIYPNLREPSHQWIEMLCHVVLTGEQVRFEQYARTYDRWLLITAFSPSDGQVATIIEDITERKKAEEALIESESLLKEAQAITRLGSWNWDLENETIIWSEEMYAIYGLPNTLKPDLQLVQELILDEDLAIFEKAFSGLENGHLPPAIEYRIRQPNGRIRYVISRAKATLNEETGQVIRLAGTLQDITERKELEEQLLLSQKMDAVGQLTAGIAHDFNNLLTAINGSAQLLQYKLPNDDPLRKIANRIADSGEHAANLIGQLMAYSRKQVVEPQLVNLNQSIKQIDSFLESSIGEQIILQTNLSSDLWPIKIDQTQIKQLIVNLAVNARDAMPDGGTLYFETTNISITPQNHVTHPQIPEGDHVQLKVSDTGLGIPQEIKDRIFEPFFTTKDVGRGTGLGLATVYSIVNQNHSHIRVNSTEGNGTTFCIYFPRENGTLTANAKKETPAVITEGHATILLVEDSDDVRAFTIEALEMQGFTIISARDGSEALEIVNSISTSFDLLLTDVMMPKINGKELADRLIEKMPHLKVIFMSGYSGDVITARGILESNTNFMQKPFTPTQLIHKIHQTLKE